MAKNTKSKPQLVRCYIINQDTHSSSSEMKELSEIPVGSIRRKHKGRPFFVLGLNGTLKDIKSDTPVTNKNLPETLYMTQVVHEFVKGLFAFSGKTIEKIKLGVFITLVFVLVIILFIIALTAMGGT